MLISVFFNCMQLSLFKECIGKIIFSVFWLLKKHLFLVLHVSYVFKLMFYDSVYENLNNVLKDFKHLH